VDAPITTHELVRPWRRAAILASSLAAVELVLLVGAGALVVAKPLSHAIRRHAETAAFSPVRHPAVIPPLPKPKPPPAAKVARDRLSILVLNGNGKSGAAGSAAGRLRRLGYRIAATANAKRQDYAATVVLYRPGFAGEGARLAHDLGVKVVGPLDGIPPASLHGGELAVILGA